MKKIHTLIIALILSGLTQTYAQLGNGWDSAFNFGGAGSQVTSLVYATNGDVYFTVDIIGKAFFAGQEIDAGAYYGFPETKHIFGKISPSGTQSILKVFKGDIFCKVNQNGELYGIIRSGNTFIPVDYGNGFSDAAFGAKMIKISNTGVTQWIKPLSTGSNVQYGNTGTPSLNVNNIKITPDGNVFISITSATFADNPPNAMTKYPHRIAKFTTDGEEVWHTDLFSSGYAGLTVPDQFVTNDGKVTFGIYTNNTDWYYNGESISSQMSIYYTAGSIIISLNADGSKNFTISNQIGNSFTGFKGVNPFTGEIYVEYGSIGTVFPTKIPYNSFPNGYAGTYLESTNYIFSGTLIFDALGNYVNYKLVKDFVIKNMVCTANGIYGYEEGFANSPITKGEYNFNSTTNYGVVSYYDQNLNFIRAIKTPRLTTIDAKENKAVFGGDFKNNLTFGSKTLIQSFNDTGFETRFPIFASVKADIFIAQADVSVTLPITLASFNASKINSGIKLTWITAAEKNSSYFEVEKSTDGQLFTTLGRVNAAGNSSERKYYSLTDFIPANGANYYRLKQVDLDGKTDLSGPVSINFDLDADAKTTVYPNPAVNELHFTGLKANSTITLSNVDGKNILSQKILNNTLQIPATVKSGMYIMHIKTNEGNTTTLKVLIAK